MAMYNVVGIDLPCVDFTLNIPSMPKPNSSLHFQKLSLQGGNKVSTGVVAAAKLGAKCALLGAVGDERFGHYCVEEFEKYGIECMLKLREGETTALSFVLSDEETKGRSIVYHPGTCKRMLIEELPMPVLQNTDYFYIAWVDETVLYATEVAKKAGAKIFVDADKPYPEMLENLKLFDVFVASEFVYTHMFQDDHYEENCRKILEMGPEIVVFTFGPDGCCGMTKTGEFFRLPAYQVEVVDTVGAGDVFHGAFLAGLLRQMPVKEAAQFASAVAAIKCTRIGGRAGIPDYETACQFIKTGEIDYLQIDQQAALYEQAIFNL